MLGHLWFIDFYMRQSCARSFPAATASRFTATMCAAGWLVCGMIVAADFYLLMTLF